MAPNTTVIKDVRSAVQARDVDAYLALHGDGYLGYELPGIIAPLVDAVLLQSLAHPERIADHLDYAVAVSHKLVARVQAQCDNMLPGDDEFAEKEQSRRGGRAVVRVLVDRLAKAVHEVTVRITTPDRDDMLGLTPNYWHIGCVHGLVLARVATLVYGSGSASEQDLSSVATQVDKDRLWDKCIRPLLGLTIFSHRSWPEPNALVMALAFLLSASGTLRAQMKPLGARVGKGVDWTWYSDEYAKPEQTWAFGDVVEAAEQGIDGKYADEYKLPAGLVTGFLDLAGLYSELEDDKTELNRDVATVYSKYFAWIAEQGPDGVEAGQRIVRTGLLVDMGQTLTQALQSQHADALSGYRVYAVQRTAEDLRRQIEDLHRFSGTHGIDVASRDPLPARIEAELKE
ncbi:hypothetical protein OC834_003756 [Tilletia horrida]|nr:hypothetical protein OC834_003756 [Tilletia horrida]KAK0529261.1 hypothetical protein OC835_004390 [Tilletia horrida]